VQVFEKIGFISKSIQKRDQNEALYNYEDLKYNLATTTTNLTEGTK
jgi:hypothetical protein